MRSPLQRAFKEEVERLMKEAETHAEEDKKRHEQVELRNEADSLDIRWIRH